LPQRCPTQFPKEKKAAHHRDNLLNIINLKWSGRGDSNSRPPAPEAGALTGLRYAPTKKIGPD
jgi:hypothetical protein